MHPAAPAALAAACALALAACGSDGGRPSSSPAGPPTVTPTPATAAPTATPTDVPDHEAVAVVRSGFGHYMLITIPVAVVQNTASAHTAVGVTVTFRVYDSANRELVATSDTIAAIDPGDSTVAAVNTEPPGYPARVTVTVAVAAWQRQPAVRFTSAGVRYSCPGCGGGATNADVIGGVTASAPVTGTVHAGAICEDASGRVVGGGAAPFAWPSGQLSATVDEAVLVSSRPAACTLAVSPATP